MLHVFLNCFTLSCKDSVRTSDECTASVKHVQAVCEKTKLSLCNHATIKGKMSLISLGCVTSPTMCTTFCHKTPLPVPFICDTCGCPNQDLQILKIIYLLKSNLFNIQTTSHTHERHFFANPAHSY